jgi:hypothetical protein
LDYENLLPFRHPRTGGCPTCPMPIFSFTAAMYRGAKAKNRVRNRTVMFWILSNSFAVCITNTKFLSQATTIFITDKTVADMQQLLPENVHYFCNSGVEINGVRFWGSPYSPKFHHFWAFNEKRGADRARHWAKISENTDILITHCPLFGIFDKTEAVILTKKTIFLSN